MPPAPKSPQSTAQPSAAAKRAGAPKAKGAVRAKSGCYTCRIRRKKCDEQPNDQGHCSTCVRLRLECLGFGAKRPDWLRENRNVLQLRDKIKNFLASQGMIKGHSGSGARSSEQPTVLRLTLTEDNSPYHSGSSSSPPTRSQTLSNEEYVPPRHHHQTSNTRSSWAAPPAMPEQAYRHSNGHYAAHGSDYHRSTSPQSIDYPPQIPSPHSLVQPLRSAERHYRHHPYRNAFQRPNAAQMPLSPNWTPAKSSALSPSYNWNDTEMSGMMDLAFLMPEEGQFNSAPPAIDWAEFSSGANATIPDAFSVQGATEGAHLLFSSIPVNVDSPFRIQDFFHLLQRYKTEVVTVQYLLGTEFIRNHIASTITCEELTIEQRAAALLSKVHFLRFSRPPNELILRDQTDVRLNLHEVENLLNQNAREPKPEDAMAALHLISVILFDGGHSGKWQQYLSFAAKYVKEKMRGSTKYKNGGTEELKRLGDKEAFIVKTAIWFDVLASVTTNESPLLIDIVRSLFKPSQSGLTELSNAAAAAAGISNDFTHDLSGDDKTSMMSPMGSDNKVVWALAEISALANWKRQLKDRGKLSIKDLVLQSNEIERELESKYTVVKIANDFPDVTSYARYLASNIFRASAHLYLHAVVNGGYPHVNQILMAVDEVMRWIRRIPQKPEKPEEKELHRTVIRSTVFAFYITGALTDNERYRKTITDYLMEEAGTVMGNCKVTLEILSEIWLERKKCGSGLQPQCKDEVLWREKLMRQSEESILLV